MRRFLLALMILLLAVAISAKETPAPASAPASSGVRPAPAASGPAEAAPAEDGEEPESQPHSAGEDGREKLAKARQVLKLHRQTIVLAAKGKFAECKPLLEESARIDPDNEITWYNLACVHARLGAPAKAIESLNKALDCGYSDFRYMEQDPDLEPLRKLAGFKAILKRNGEIQRSRAGKIESELKTRFGEGYICEVDHARKLVFATNIDRRTLDELKTYLTAYAEAQWKGLFSHHFEQYVTIVVPNPSDAPQRAGVAGYYTHDTRTLVARQIGMVMTHEFTHALHDADQDGFGQRHPIWVTEGLATLFETSDIRDGQVVPLANERLNLLKRLIDGKKTIPFKEFLKISQPEFMKQSVVAYAEGRYVMMYLHDRGLLKKWYDLYNAEHDKDPSGGAAMEAVFGKPLAQVEADWLTWVNGQKDPPLSLHPDAAHIGVRTQNQPDGLRIVQIVPLSGADKAGLKPGDVIVKVDGQRVIEGGALIRTVSERKVGEKLEIQFRRDGTYKDVTVTLSRLPQETTRPAPAPRRRPRPTTAPAETRPADTRPADTQPATKKAA